MSTSWQSEVEALLAEISNQPSQPDSPWEWPSTASLRAPSLRELVKEELMADRQPCRSIGELTAEREAAIGHLETARLNKEIEKNRKLRMAVSQRTPASNSLRLSSTRLPSNLQSGRECILEFEVFSRRWGGFTSSTYGLAAPPEQLAKVLALEISASSTFGSLYDAIVESLPVRKTYEANSYKNGGMLVFARPTDGHTFVFSDQRGGDNFCDYAKYVTNLALESPSVYSLDERRLDQHGDLWLASREDQTSSSSSSLVLGYLVHTGDQAERIYVSNIKVRQLREDQTPWLLVKYKRCVRKMSWCVLCGSRVAELTIVDDPLLPHTPCFVCKDCYRSFRSDAEGNFIDPPEHVGVFLFQEF